MTRVKRFIVARATDRVEDEEEDPTDAPFCVNAAALGLIGRGGASFLLFPHPHPNLIITLPPISLLPTAHHHHHLLLHPQCGSRLHSRSDTLNSWQGIFASRTVTEFLASKTMGVRQRVKRAEEWQSFRAGIYQIVPTFRPSFPSMKPCLGMPG